MAAVLVLFAAVSAYFVVLRIVFGVSYDPSYSDLAEQAASIEAVPLVLRQLSHNLFAILQLLKICVLISLMRHWHSQRWRIVLLAWLVVEGLLTVTRMGARTWYAMLLLAAVLLYHRLVKPLPLAKAGTLGAVLLAGALVYGVTRDVGGGLQTVTSAQQSPWATMNEFQALYGISFDLHARHLAGTTGPIPWQIYAADFIRLVPSQLLPFDKADPCLGYPQVDGIGPGCVLGVISNAVLGLDWVELVIRGLILGLVFALIHRWYVRHQEGYWATLFYVSMCLWSYYTFRGSTFYFLYDLVYRLIPLMIGVRVVQILIRQTNRLVALPAA
jgi:hypothetical protein